MSISKASNWRAVFFLVAPLVLVTGSVVPAGATAFLTDEANGVNLQLFGAAISELEDMNGDGRGELLIGAPGDNVNGSLAGAVFYYRSRSTNSQGLEQVWRGNGGEKFGFAVARVGDVNGDGTPDFAVGAPLCDTGGTNRGRVCLFWGGSTISSTPDLVIYGSAGSDQFGYSISAAGDFNGDGEDDFIVGAPFKDANGTDNGAAFVIFGQSGGPSTDLADAVMLTGQIAGDHFGWSVTGAGNFLGTANDCVAVGAPLNTEYGMDAGAAYVYEGSTYPQTPNSVFDLKIHNGSAAAPFSQYGFAVRGIGQWNNDGFDDLAIGAPYCNSNGSEAGRVEIVFGGASPSNTGDRYVKGQLATDHFGWSLARVGDINGSGEDLLVGAPGYDADAADGGRAYLYYGGSPSYNSAASCEVLPVDPLNPGTAANDKYGEAVASAGYFDNDGILDYAVGAPGGNIGNASTAGYVWVKDSGDQVVAAYLSAWRAVWTAEGTVAVEFSIAQPVGQLAALSLERQGLDRNGDPQASDLIWSGPVNLSGPVDLGSGLAFDGTVFTYTDDEALEGMPAGGDLLYSLTITDQDGQSFTLDSLAGPGAYLGGPLPGNMVALDPAWPNPFNPLVSIRFVAPAGQHAVCRVTDLRGRVVATLFAGDGPGDWRTVTWNGRTDAGSQAPSGVYFIRLETDTGTAVRRVVLAK